MKLILRPRIPDGGLMLEKLNTPGGHIVVYFGLIFTGIGMHIGKIPHAEDITFGSFTALLAVLAPKLLSAIAAPKV